MVKFDVEGGQNVEVSKKIKCEKPLVSQLEIMEKYTETHKRFSDCSKERREIECLKVIYPKMFRTIESDDLIAGRLDFLPIGFGCVTSVGGVGHYCVFAKLRAFQKEISQLGEDYSHRVQCLYDYWLDHDLKTDYCRKTLTETTVGRFIDVNYPLIATARLSGMMLDYEKLLDNGISGLKKIISQKLKNAPENEFYKTSIECLDLFSESGIYLADMAEKQAKTADSKRKNELEKMSENLRKISTDKPETLAYGA